MQKSLLLRIGELWKDILETGFSVVNIRSHTNTLLIDIERDLPIGKERVKYLLEAISFARSDLKSLREHAIQVGISELALLIDRLLSRLDEIETIARAIQGKLQEKPQNLEAIKKDLEAIWKTADEIAVELDKAYNIFKKIFYFLVEQLTELIPS